MRHAPVLSIAILLQAVLGVFGADVQWGPPVSGALWASLRSLCGLVIIFQDLSRGAESGGPLLKVVTWHMARSTRFKIPDLKDTRHLDSRKWLQGVFLDTRLHGRAVNKFRGDLAMM